MDDATVLASFLHEALLEATLPLFFSSSADAGGSKAEAGLAKSYMRSGEMIQW